MSHLLVFLSHDEAGFCFERFPSAPTCKQLLLNVRMQLNNVIWRTPVGATTLCPCCTPLHGISCRFWGAFCVQLLCAA